MSESKNLRKLLEQWGGTTSAFFTYTHFSHDLIPALLVPLLPLIRESLGLSYLQSGLLISAYAITSGLSQVPMGWFGDRTSRRVVVAIGLVGISLAAIGIGLSRTYYPILIILVVMGIFAGAYHPSATSMLSGYFERERRGSVLGLHMVGGSTGFALGPILGGLIANILGWRFAFIILSIPALVAAPLVLRKFRLSERANNGEQLSQALISKDAPVKATSGFSSIVKALRPIAVVCALTILAQLIVGCAMAFFPLYLVDKHGILAAYAAMWLGVVRGGGMAGSLLGGWLSDKWSRKNVVLLSIITVGPALYLITLLPFNIALIAVFVLFGIIVIMRQPAIQTLLLDTAPAQYRATVIGFYFFLSMEGMSLAQPIAGHFMDAYGIVRVFNVIALISVGLSVVALLWVIRSKLSR